MVFFSYVILKHSENAFSYTCLRYKIDFPSITGNDTSAPTLPNPNNLVPSVTMAILLPFDVSAYLESGFLMISLDTDATPVV